MTDSIDTGDSDVQVTQIGDLWRLSIRGCVGIPEPRFRETSALTRLDVLDTLDFFLKLWYIFPATPAVVIDSQGRARHGVVRDFRDKLKLPEAPEPDKD